MASDSAMMAGWAFSVRVRSASGPSHISLESFWESASSTSWNTSRAGAKASARSLPMPTFWLPCPGKRNARVITGRDKSIGLAGVKLGEISAPDHDHRNAAQNQHDGDETKTQSIGSGLLFGPAHHSGAEETAQVGKTVEQRQPRRRRGAAQQ